MVFHGPFRLSFWRADGLLAIYNRRNPHATIEPLEDQSEP
jgi:hypothetical protein